ncbi:MAG: hypothetical protein AB8B56_17810 [Crocinitomicaceae bacterium]
MKFNNKGLRQTSSLINYTIAILLCGFLILFSSILIDDVDEWKEKPSVEEFQNPILLSKQNGEISVINQQISVWKEKEKNVQRTLETTEKKYEGAKRSFDNWLKARKTIGSPKEDPEVINRANELDSYFKTKLEWEKELTRFNDSIDIFRRDKKKVEKIMSLDNQRAEEDQFKAVRKYDLRIFLIRLMIILPLLIVGVFFILRFRNHKYWPLFLGFILFSLYTFFFGLVPYLPDYGGYIRYSVGIVLIVSMGAYAINRIRKFVEQKRNELKTSSHERAKKVQAETAEKALEKHMCPSCGKDYTIKGWDKTLKKNNKTQTHVLIPNFCRHCGLELFKKCKSCETENYAHLPYCCNCGDSISADEVREECSDNSY